MTKSISATLLANATDTIDLTEGQVQETPHVFIGIKFLVAGVAVTPSAGTFSITARIRGMDDFESIPGGDTIDATAALSSLSFAGNADEIKYTPAGITGADEVRITITGNLA